VAARRAPRGADAAPPKAWPGRPGARGSQLRRSHWRTLPEVCDCLEPMEAAERREETEQAREKPPAPAKAPLLSYSDALEVAWLPAKLLLLTQLRRVSSRQLLEHSDRS